MPDASKPTISPEFGHYFAGIADGEGHFAISRRTKRGKTTYGCAFVIIMRDDDREFIEWLQETTGLGSLYSIGARQKVGHASKPQVMWQVQNQRDCSALADIFEQYPLRTRKARDLAIWLSATRYWSGPKPYGLEPMERWFKLIREVREYGGVESLEDEPLDILSLFEGEAWA